MVDRSPAFKDSKSEIFVLPVKHQRVVEHRDIGPSFSSASHHTSSVGGTSSERSQLSHSSYHKKSKTGYEGLANEGATCYLNSLLQTLFMTPEFRSAVYDWSFEKWCRPVFEEKLAEQQKKNLADGIEKKSTKSIEERYQSFKEKAEESSIPRQLQKLFLRLQLGDVRAETTGALTKSFGWERSEAFNQHDVQELCRVLLDALENGYKGTERHNIVNELYQGEMKDYVKCLHCGHEGSRTDSFLDIPLVIKAFGETVAVKSIEEGLQKFIEAETLTGDNKYNCESCNGARDAIKGLKFTKFPYLLALQLKRFDFDFVHMRRQKLNDRVTFPEVLDMNPYLDKHIQKQKGIDVDMANLTLNVDESHETKEESKAETVSMDIGEKEDRNEKDERRQEEIQKALKNGPHVYELFSILIHRGSAMGGHYYCYIRSFRTGEWMCFNDSTVSFMSESDFDEAYGSKRDANSQSGVNAYMLMYRKYDPIKNVMEISKEELSEEFKAIIEEENNKKKEKEEAQKNALLILKLKIYSKGEFKEIEVNKEDKMEDFVKLSASTFGYDQLLTEGNFRLREYSLHSDIPGKVMDAKSTDKVDCCRFYTGKTFIIETKTDSETFAQFNPDDLTLKFFTYNEAAKEWTTQHKIISIDRECIVRDLKRKLEPLVGIPASELIISREDMCSPVDATTLDNDNKGLRQDLRIFEGTKIWVERKQQDAQSPPRAFEEITRLKNAIEIQFTNPGEEKHVHSVKTSKKTSFGSLKKTIGETLKFSIDEFRVFRGPLQFKTELRNYEDALSEQGITGSHKLYIELGTPIKSGDVVFRFVIFDPLADIQIQDFCTMPLSAKLTVAEAKVEIVKMFHERQKDEKTKFALPDWDIGNPENLRLREINLNPVNPRSIYMDQQTVKHMSKNLMFTIPDIAIQKLPNGQQETKENKEHIIFFLQEFNNETFTLGPRFEFETYDPETLTSFRDRISKTTGISQVGLIGGDGWLGHKRLDIPHLKWNPPPETESSRAQNDSTRVKSLNIQDGDLVLFKDMTVVPMPLTDAEKKAISEADSKRRTLLTSSGRGTKKFARQENRLVIQQKDVALDDDDK
jgi:ubiquitin C-terminal hydrolase